MTGGARRAGVAELRTVALILATAVVYYVSAKIGLSLAFVAEQVTVVWPPTGIALAALLIVGPQLWPGIALGAFVANLTANAPLLVAASISAGNTLEAVIAAQLLRRLDFHLTLGRLRDVLALVLAAALGSTLISATVGAMSLCFGDLAPWDRYWSLWGVWWVGDAMGDLIVAPFLMVWSRVPRGGLGTRLRFETVGLALLTIGLCWLLLAGSPALGVHNYPLHYAVFPLVIIAALRLRQVGTTMVTCLAVGIATWSTAHGIGPFVMATTHESLIMLQLFMGIVATTGLLLSAALIERDHALERQGADLTALEASEAWLRLALEAGQLGLWDWNFDTGAVRWTDNLERIHGLPPGGFRGTFAAFQSLVHPDDRARVDAAVQRAVDDGSSYDIEFRNVWSDGSVHWMAAKGLVIPDVQGRGSRMLGTAMEVTARRKLEEELRERAHELADADRRKDEFLAMLAHELRNPLAPLSTSLHLLTKDTGDRDRFIEIAERQVRHLVRLVDDLLDVSRISSGKVVLRRDVVEIADVVARAIELTQPLLDTRGHHLTVSLPTQPVRLHADLVRLSQVIANLLNNAIKYTQPGGSIWLTAEAGDAEIVVTVRDTGIGLPPELLPRIFDLFVQGDASLDRARGGLGIGLTLVRGLVALHGGRVEARSDGVGRGSTFVIHLPTVTTDGAAATPEPVRHDRATRGPLRVLIIEDNQDSAESLAVMLELWGHTVKVVFDGFAALDAAKQFAPDVIISDLGLPGMDGYEIARRLRAEPCLAGVTLVALSGYGGEEYRQRSLDVGFDHHQVKPVDVTWLSNLLQQVRPTGPG